MLAKRSDSCFLPTVDPRGFPTNLPEFQRVFPSDDACAAYLEKLRWPGGFACPKCGTLGDPYRFPKRSSVVLRCRGCRANVSLTAGTVMQASHMPLSVWFWGAYLVTTQTPGQSALQFQRQLGISRYETAFQMLHKLRAGMVRPDRDTIGEQYPVEIDETLVGGRTRGEGRGVHHKAIVVGAVEVRRRFENKDCTITELRNHTEEKRPKRALYAGRLRLRLVRSRDAEDLIGFVKENVTKGAVVRTDGWQSYDSLAKIGYDHQAVVVDGDPEKTEAHLPMIHLVFSNLKTWISGTHHGVSQQHLQAYLNEYVFRFNRRFYPMTAFNSVLGLVVHAVPPTYEELYSGKWIHPSA
jgi:transposase-like protein